MIAKTSTHSNGKPDSDSAITGSSGLLSDSVLCPHYVLLPLHPVCPPTSEEVCAVTSHSEDGRTEMHKKNLSSPHLNSRMEVWVSVAFSGSQITTPPVHII